METGAQALLENLEWSVRPADQHPSKRIVIALAAAAAFGIGYSIFHNPMIPLIGVAAILFSTAEFWLGTKYILTPQSATSKCGLSVTEVAWTSVQRIVDDGERMTLSSVSEKSPLANFRGITLRMDQNQRAAVVAFLKEHCADHAGNLG